MAKKPKLAPIENPCAEIVYKPATPIIIDDDLVADLLQMANDRQIPVGRLINSRIRSLINSYKRHRVFGLSDTMPYGQYTGMNIEEMIRADPRYVHYMASNSDTFQLDDESLALLGRM